FLAGLIWSAVLAAIMSTSSAQLLVTASSVSQDLYKNLIGRKTTDRELILVSRITVLIIAAIALFLALDPNSYILTMVAYAWAGFGAAFGPAILISLFWRRMTRKGCIAGVVVGGVTVLIWKQFAWFDLYEIVPGFLFSAIAIYVVSLLDAPPEQAITDEFDAAQKMHIL
ncbi:MAG: sodium:proline symporter, partial [Veillonella sp.]|nr:sodium:proline symporter [Veillonella sp.]